MRGRKAKPTQLKVIQGNPGKRKLPEHEPDMPLADEDCCPGYFVDGGHAHGEWARLFPLLSESRVMTQADTQALEMYCSLYQQYRDALDALDTQGLIIQNEKGSSRNPASVTAMQAAQQMRMYMVELGITPSSRSKVKTVPKPKVDRLGEFLDAKRKAKHPVQSYMDGVLSGEVPACEGIIKAVKRQVYDLETGHERGLRFDPKEGQRVIDFFQFLKHSKGEWSGQTFELAPWQQFILWCLFGWKRADNTRRFRVGYIEIPRKNGKTTLSAGIGLYLFMADGEDGAEVYSAATKRDQARICHGEAIRMVKTSARLAERVGVFRDNLHIVDTACKFEPLGADADSMDGLNIHAAVVDELHAHKNRRMWDVIDTATGSRRQPLIFAITTAGNHGESICYEQHDYTQKVLDNIFEDDSHFGFIAHMDKDADWTDPVEWQKANPNYGISVKADDLARKCEKAKRVASLQNAFLRLHLNVWTQKEPRWLSMDDWDACPQKATWNLLKGRECYVGLDLANTIDVAAAALVFPPDEGEVWQVLVKFWIPEERILEKVRRDRVPYDAWVRDGWVNATEGNVIDYDFIREDINQLADEFQVLEIGADPWNATQITTQLVSDGHTVVPVRQGYYTLSSPTKRLEGLIVSHKIDHGGNPVLRWMASNVAVMQGPAGNIKPAKDRSGEKIDGTAATVIGLSRALVHQDESGTIYDSAELFVV